MAPDVVVKNAWDVAGLFGGHSLFWFETHWLESRSSG
jgi:hypothetical protein